MPSTTSRNSPRFRIIALEERIAPSTVVDIGAKAHHDTVVVDGGDGDVNINFGPKAHHDKVVVIGGDGDVNVCFGAKAHHDSVVVVGGSDGCGCGC